MVCVPCFIIPLLLWLWHRFVQPYVLRWWNPWAVKDAQGRPTGETAVPFACAGGVCKLRLGSSGVVEGEGHGTTRPVAELDKPKAD